MKNTTLSKPALLGAGWAGSGNSATVSDFSHKPCLMGVLNSGCEQKGNERVERPRPANHKCKRVLKRHVLASTEINETRARSNTPVFTTNSITFSNNISFYNEKYYRQT